MSTDLKEHIRNGLAALPDPSEIRRRISENLNERQLLRQLLRLSEQRAKAEALGLTAGVRK